MSVEKIIAEHLNIDESSISDDSKIVEDLGADSLHTVELVMKFENTYDMEIPDEDTDNLITVGDVKKYIEEYS
jgi:acyl carrier protein|tara:strand:+ start:4263 stop:4481 length:219 start_codon:yes stop_codon:yes gene_type:complete